METLPFPDNLSQQEERFWHLVDNIGKTSAECWPWMGGRWKQGYGVFKMVLDGEWKRYKAHRVAYRLHHGKDLEHLGCHACDNPWCVNPYHIFDGTNADNIEDMWRKGRGPSGKKSGRHTKPEKTARGERGGTAKLTADDVRYIRSVYTPAKIGGRNPIVQELTQRYGIRREYLHAIVTRKTWRHLED